MTSDEAYRAGQSAVAYPTGKDFSSYSIHFATFTDYGSGVADKDGSFKRDYDGIPVWVVTFEGVPTAPSGPAGGEGSSRQTRVVLAERVIVIDDATRRPLVELDDTHDAVAAVPRT